jgi:hypothetical protein
LLKDWRKYLYKVIVLAKETAKVSDREVGHFQHDILGVRGTDQTGRKKKKI